MTAEVRINALAYGGSFVGDVVQGREESKGKRAFVPFVAPGELVRIRVTKEEKRFLEGEAEEILERSPSRIEAPCPHFTVCGGCDLQHLPISEQRELKRAMIESTLRRQGGVTAVRGVSCAPAALPEYRYRRRVTLHIDHAGEIGFYRPKSGEVVPIQRCLIASDKVNEAISHLIAAASEIRSEIGAVVIEQNDAGEISLLFLPRDGIPARTPLPESIRNNFSRFSIRGAKESAEAGESDGTGHFSQVNASANEELIRLVLERLTAPVITDLYAGSGNFSLPLAEAGRTVTAVELDGTLVSLGMKAAQVRGLSGKVRFVASSCEHYMKRNHPTEGVLLDPPRGGAKEVVQRLEPNRTKQIVYVSCNLPSLTRDLQILSTRGYELVETIFVDMFPQTHHVETVSLITSTFS